VGTGGVAGWDRRLGGAGGAWRGCSTGSPREERGGSGWGAGGGGQGARAGAGTAGRGSRHGARADGRGQRQSREPVRGRAAAQVGSGVGGRRRPANGRVEGSRALLERRIQTQSHQSTTTTHTHDGAICTVTQQQSPPPPLTTPQTPRTNCTHKIEQCHRRPTRRRRKRLESASQEDEGPSGRRTSPAGQDELVRGSKSANRGLGRDPSLSRAGRARAPKPTRTVPSRRGRE
jgi:hypothetical protein